MFVDGKVIFRFGVGDYFGEVCLFGGMWCIVMVWVCELLVLWEFDGKVFGDVLYRDVVMCEIVYGVVCIWFMYVGVFEFLMV